MSVEDKRKIKSKKPYNGKKPFVGRVYIGSKNGTPILRSRSFERKKDAENFVRDLSQNRSGGYDRSISDKVMLQAVFASYIERISTTKKDNTIKSYLSTYKKWIAPELEVIPIGKINQITILRFFATIRQQGASEYIVNYCHIVLDQLFKFATESIQRYITENPMDGLQKPALEYSPVTSIKYWSKEHTEKFLDASKGTAWNLIFTIFLNTGIRTSEGAAISEQSFDFERGALDITGQITNFKPKANEDIVGALYCLSQTKNKETRSIPLKPQAIKAAKLLIAKNKEWGNYFLFHPYRKSKGHKIVLKRGPKPQVIEAQIITSKTIGNAVKHFAELAGVENIGPHGLRHTFAANFLMNGGDIFTLSRILGHKNITSTQIYSHLSQTYMASAMNIVGFGG